MIKIKKKRTKGQGKEVENENEGKGEGMQAEGGVECHLLNSRTGKQRRHEERGGGKGDGEEEH